MRKVDEAMFVSGQVRPEDLPSLAAAGVMMVVNNRPDGEQPGQPQGEALEQAALAAGLFYRAIPVRPGSLSQEQVDAMREALDAAQGPVLAFCAAGVRSIFLWALAKRQAGEDGARIMRKAAEAGYDLSPIAGYLVSREPGS
jgi:uncharacterized protein (TIGR01244 family)